jgi:hypothetical protein
METNDVVISVLGGCVNGVFSDIPNIRVVLIDWDNINESPRDALLRSEPNNLASPLNEMPAEARLAYECLISEPSTSKAR